MTELTLGSIRLGTLRAALSYAGRGMRNEMEQCLSLAQGYSSEMELPWSERVEQRIRGAYVPPPVVHVGSLGYNALAAIHLNGGLFYAAWVENIVGPEVTNVLTRGGFVEFSKEQPDTIKLTREGREALYNAVRT